MTLGRLWAGWRGEYVTTAGDASVECVFCRIIASGEPDEATHIIWRGESVFAILNAYPYTSGHVMVMPYRHVFDFNQALMDFGATVCVARNPKCAACPMAKSCRAFPYEPGPRRRRRA